MNKKLLLSLVAASVLAACDTTPKKPAEVAAAPAAPTEVKTETKAPVATDRIAKADDIKPTVEESPFPKKGEGGALGERSVFYDFDSYVVNDAGRAVAEAHGKWILDHKTAKLILQGNTDERGSREYNLALGQRRSDSVKKILTVQGVPDTQIETVSFGKEKPRNPGHDEDSWKENRRVDLVYQGE